MTKKKYVCNACKATVSDSQKFCHNCGGELVPVQDKELLKKPATGTEVKPSHKDAKFKDGDIVVVKTYGSDENKQGFVAGVVMNGLKPKTDKDGIVYKVAFSSTDKDPQEYGEGRLRLGEAGV